MALFLASSTVAQETVVFKQPPTALEVCTYDAKLLEAKIAELQNINAQLAAKARALEVPVVPVVAKRVAKPRKTQVCKRWKPHKCTWWVWK